MRRRTLLPWRPLFALAQAACRVGKCKLLGHKFVVLVVPVPVEASEKYGAVPLYAESRLIFENIVRVSRMVDQPPVERRCKRCYVRPPLPEARVAP